MLIVKMNAEKVNIFNTFSIFIFYIYMLMLLYNIINNDDLKRKTFCLQTID